MPMPTSRLRPTSRSRCRGARFLCCCRRERSRACKRGVSSRNVMNRYPLWKYIVIGVALLIGVFYTLPNFFPEVPAVQVSTSKSNVKIDAATLQTVQEALKAANVPFRGETVDATGVKVRFADPDTQLKAKDVLQAKLNPDPNNPNYIVALNLLSSSPRWLAIIGALPMYLGLDLRGGVHFLLQVDMKAALDKAADRYTTDIRSLLREKKVLYAGIAREGPSVVVRFRDDAERAKARTEIEKAFADLLLREADVGGEFRLVSALKPEAQKDRKSTRLNSSHVRISYAVFCLKKKKSQTSVVCVMKKKNRKRIIY